MLQKNNPQVSPSQGHILIQFGYEVADALHRGFGGKDDYGVGPLKRNDLNRLRTESLLGGGRDKQLANSFGYTFC